VVVADSFTRGWGHPHESGADRERARSDRQRSGFYNQPCGRGYLTVLATAPTGATPPRLLGNPLVRRHSIPHVIEDLWATATTLLALGTPVPTDPDYRPRVRLVRTDFKYPLVRLEETL
jgi:hypothetical protein